MNQKAFASQADLEEKQVSFVELGPGAFAYTAEGDPNSGIVVTDPKAASISCPTTTLLPLASTICTGSHTVTAAEAVAGSFVNTATAAATKTETISNVVTTTPVTSRTATATAPIATPAPALTLTKAALLTDTNGKHAFATTYAQHQANIADARRRGVIP